MTKSTYEASFVVDECASRPTCSTSGEPRASALLKIDEMLGKLQHMHIDRLFSTSIKYKSNQNSLIQISRHRPLSDSEPSYEAYSKRPRLRSESHPWQHALFENFGHQSRQILDEKMHGTFGDFVGPIVPPVAAIDCYDSFATVRGITESSCKKPELLLQIACAFR
ncbi:jg16273 [Pararge aegeria aegeria]|uniref:Jg16273 protein n=1 Tax=Pararge aegeria aegeria TaxID=348720 RepID=A0A8S4RWH6_9NEOP|nr:jg16273 [Pararge aegeria aegeria]